jgi:hypothetical protein
MTNNYLNHFFQEFIETYRGTTEVLVKMSHSMVFISTDIEGLPLNQVNTDEFLGISPLLKINKPEIG